MKILVTGGAGFVGSHLVDQLVAQDHEVLILDDLSTGKKEYINPQADFEHVRIQDALAADCVTAFAPDVVYHLAAQKNVRYSLENPVADAEINIIGSLRMCDAAVRAGSSAFVFVSSGGAIYDEQAVPADEHALEKPLSPYGLAKQTIDYYLQYFHAQHTIRTISFRPANIYGPRQDPKGEAGVIALFFEALRDNKKAMIFGGDQTRDFIYVKDVVDALVLALEKGQGTYNLGTGIETSVTDLYNLQATIAHSHATPTIKDYVQGEMMRSVLISSRMRDDFDWQPQVDLQAGLEKTWNWFKQEAA